MKFLDKKPQQILNYASKAISFLVLLSVLLMPLAQVSAAYDLSPATEGGQMSNMSGTSVKPAQELTQDALACSLTNASVCLANVVYAFTVGLGSGLAYVGGFMFDTTVSLSLNSAAYALSFLSSGWTTARDLANMAFILILVYIAFMIMFQAETAHTIQMLAWVIFIALIINFSFFFTRVVIDVGNILAVQFYNSIQAPTMQGTMNVTTGTVATTATGIANTLAPQGTFANTKDLTFSIMNALNIQELFNDKNFQSFAGQSGFGTKFIILSFLYIMVGACYFILAAMFFAVSVKFLMRIVVLWFLIIASPLAFVCKAVPNKPEISGWYDSWQHELVKHAFYPAFFLFIFFFVSTIMTGLSGPTGILAGLATDLNGAASNLNGFIFIASAVANVGIRLGFVVAMLYIALKASEYMGVKGGELAHGITNRVGGFAKYGASLPIRGAFAGTAWTGRNTVGRGSYLLSRTSGVQNLAANSIFGRPVKAALGSLEKASFDMRGTSVGKNLKNVAGEAGGKDGFAKQISNRAKNIEARAKELKETNEAQIQAKQRALEREYDDGTGNKGQAAYDAKIADLNRAREDALRDQRAAEAIGDKAAAKAAIGHQKEADKQIKDLQGMGKKQLDEAGKMRIKAFADRLGNRNLQNLGWPSRGSIEGASKALKLTNKKSAKDEAYEAMKKAAKEDDDHEPEGGGPGGGSGGAGGAGGSGGTSGGSSGGSASGGGSHGAAPGGGAHASAGANATVSLDKHSTEELRGIREDLKEYAEKVASRLESHPAFKKDAAPTITLSTKQLNVLGSAIGKAVQNPQAPEAPSASNDNEKPGESKAA